MCSPLDDLLRQFVPLGIGSETTEMVRGGALALAQDWLLRVPEGPQKEAALEHLAEAVALACGAVKAPSAPEVVA